MHAKGFLHKLLLSVMHKKRLESLILLVTTLLLCKKLSLTGLGRGIELAIQQRSGIRRADRFLGNKKLKRELLGIYSCHARNLIGNIGKPKIIADWTHIPNTDLYALRAALVTKGRALTIYEEVHPEKKLGNVRVEKRFLQTLKEILPADCKPIIITDAGFRNPWFKEVKALGWDFVGRVRGTHQYYDGVEWLNCNDLHSRATKTAKYLGNFLLCKTNGISVHLFLLKEKLQRKVWRKRYRKKGSGKNDVENYRKGARMPWLIASSLSGNSPVKTTRVIKLYKTRMQIEEGFRDLKNPKYGFGLRDAHSRGKERIQILLLIALFASLIAWLIGFKAEQNGWHYQFQTNSIKTRRVLSLFFLGCCVIKKNMAIPENSLECTVEEVWRIAA